MTTMEEAIAEDARSILIVADLQDRDFDEILDGIRHRARSILQTLEEGDPLDG